MIRFLAFSVFAVCLAVAQDRPGPGGPGAPGQGPGPGMGMRGNAFPWWDSPIVQDMKLSDDQQKQIRDTVRDYRSKLIELRAALEKAEGELNDVYEDEKIDQRKAIEAIEHVVTARSDLTRTFSQMSLKLRAVLTLDQWRELEKRRPLREWRPGGMRQGRRQSIDKQPTPPPKPPAPQN
jgi:Spy/CpxP family protein refolding chaperone